MPSFSSGESPSLDILDILHLPQRGPDTDILKFLLLVW